MAMNYQTFVDTIANIMATDKTTLEFEQILPQAIAYSEDRIYREIDALNTVWYASTNLTANDRHFVTPPAEYGNFLTVTGVNVYAGFPTQRVVLEPVSVSFLNSVYGTANSASVPKYFAMLRQNDVIVGPYPDQDYVAEVYGTYQPAPLSETNPMTFITTYLPDLMVAAAMIFMTGYMRDFGSQADNPQQAQSWSSQYDVLFRSANLLELRKRFVGPGWTSLSSVPVIPTR
jgi:hypothetical protein